MLRFDDAAADFDGPFFDVVVHVPASLLGLIGTLYEWVAHLCVVTEPDKLGLADIFAKALIGQVEQQGNPSKVKTGKKA
ncbi:hypothetical protein [Paenibacillus alvei]|uniref:hypothetical protein n=1 Tax=Paenibacillus alvei TaxID=44250 RepID=UPI000385D91C|nr:hypothetical protein [Paenibacillus alvei]EPY09527.1 hypothetical protein PAAL66ix_26103 [Paenibacillus alvei A6-6i-x]GAV12453.1 hypothetical protein PBN151_2386 [Paenibacillus sp. NAIST15-1]